MQIWQCLSVGLLPYLVNTANRKQKEIQQMKSSTSEQGIQVWVWKHYSNIKNTFNSGWIRMKMSEPRPEDLFENGQILLKSWTSMEDIFSTKYGWKPLAIANKLNQWMSCIQQLRQKKIYNNAPLNVVDVFKSIILLSKTSILPRQMIGVRNRWKCRNLNINKLVAMDGCFQL